MAAGGPSPGSQAMTAEQDIFIPRGQHHGLAIGNSHRARAETKEHEEKRARKLAQLHDPTTGAPGLGE